MRNGFTTKQRGEERLSISRRRFLTLLAAPAVIRVATLMPVHTPPLWASRGVLLFESTPGWDTSFTYELYQQSLIQAMAQSFVVPYETLAEDQDKAFYSSRIEATRGRIRGNT